MQDRDEYSASSSGSVWTMEESTTNRIKINVYFHLLWKSERQQGKYNMSAYLNIYMAIRVFTIDSSGLKRIQHNNCEH